MTRYLYRLECGTRIADDDPTRVGALAYCPKCGKQERIVDAELFTDEDVLA